MSVVVDRATDARPRATGREVVIVAAALAAVTTVVFAGWVRHGGLYADDWTFFDIDLGFHGYWNQVGAFDWTSSRPLQQLYWPVIGDLLTPHAALRAWAVALAAGFSLAVFVLSRELGLAPRHAGVIAVLLLVFPASDSTRFWAAASIGSLTLAVWILGAMAVLAGLRTRGVRAALLHIVGLVLYVASLLTYEAASPFMALSGVIYLRASSRRRRYALLRWTIDLATLIVITLRFSENGFYQQGSLADDLGHAWAIANGALAVLGEAVVPFAGPSRVTGSVALVAIAAAGLVAWRWRPDLRGWTALACIGIAVLAVAYAVYIPVLDDFYPLHRGLENRVNLAAAVGYVMIAYALIMVVWVVISRRARRAGAAIAGALIVLLGAGYLHHLQVDEHQWLTAAAKQRVDLATIDAAVGRPAPGTVVFAFGEQLYQAVQIPIFDADSDLDAAYRWRWHDNSLDAYPMAHGMTFTCGRHNVSFDPSNTGLDYGDPHSDSYGHTFFVDVAARTALLIRNTATCRAALRRFKPGPTGPQ